MPFQADLFVTAYQWDYHCQELFERLNVRLRRLLRQLEQLAAHPTAEGEQLLSYYKKWHTSHALYKQTRRTLYIKRESLRSMGYRGYGVSYDLLRALDDLDQDLERQIEGRLEQCFEQPLERVFALTGLSPQSLEEDRSFFRDSLTCENTLRGLSPQNLEEGPAQAIVDALCRQLDRPPEKLPPFRPPPVSPPLERYFQRMSQETPWPANTAIFQKLFLRLGSSSMTIMRGTIGYENPWSPQELKLRGNENFLQTFAQTFANLHHFTDISLDLVQHIHATLAQGLLPDAGELRHHDFSDKNGVTVEFGNLKRELGELKEVLSQTAQSFDDLERLLSFLARAYYLLLGIHPFRDSNGRVARCFLNHLLLKKGLPPLSFNKEEELFALPRYGGTVEDMESYLQERIAVALQSYDREREKLEERGWLERPIGNVSFDSGFFFRQIGPTPPQVEIHFTGYVVPRYHPLFEELHEECRVVFPDRIALYNLKVFCGFCQQRQDEWEHSFCLRYAFDFQQAPTDVEEASAFEVECVLQLEDYHRAYRYLQCCVVSHDGALIHNNKGLNYAYLLEW